MSGNNKLVAHTLVKNEARWIWFAISSVLDVVDEMLVWDTGSTDLTVDIIKSINSDKITFRQIGSVDAMGHTAARQAMLDAYKSDWILILDGDEIWYQQSLAKCVEAVSRRPAISALISPFINLVGDVYHYQDPGGSHYRIGQYQGPYNLRFINRRISGLHVANPHGRQEYRDAHNLPVQSFPAEKLLLVDSPYLHTTHLTRSASRLTDQRTLKRGFKFRYELGRALPSGFIYPEVFYLPRPEMVPDPWTPRPLDYVARSLVYAPIRLIRSFFFSNLPKGY